MKESVYLIKMDYQMFAFIATVVKSINELKNNAYI